MTTLEIITQIVGIIAMALVVISFQMKTPNVLLTFTTIGNVVWTIHFYLTGLTTGSFMGFYMNLISIVRSFFLVLRSKKYKWAQSNLWFLAFSLVFAGFYVLDFTVFGTEPTTKNFILEVLPVIACITGTISLGMKSAKLIRFTYYTSSPFWLVYDAFVHSIGGVLTEVFTLCSITVAIIRLDIKKKDKKELKD